MLSAASNAIVLRFARRAKYLATVSYLCSIRASRETRGTVSALVVSRRSSKSRRSCSRQSVVGVLLATLSFQKATHLVPPPTTLRWLSVHVIVFVPGSEQIRLLIGSVVPLKLFKYQ